MKILLIANRILFFLSFFLPFFLLPHCEGPTAEENEAKVKAFQDSVRLCDTVNQAYLELSPDKTLTIHQTDTTISSSSPTVHPDTTISTTETNNLTLKNNSFLEYPTENSISGYGIALLSFNRSIRGINTFSLLFSFLLSIACIIMIFRRKSHNSQIIISVLSLLFLITFVCIGLSDNTPIEAILWGFWTCLILSLTNVIITIIMKRKNT